MDDERRIQILEKSFDYMEQFILECYVPNDEESTTTLIVKMYNRILKSLDDEVEIEALKRAYKKIFELTFDEVEEIYETLK